MVKTTAALQAANTTLDRRIAERTAELTSANDLLRLYRALFDNSNDAILIGDLDEGILLD